MSIDRSKFKKSSASQMAQADRELNKTMGKKTNSNGHEVEEGTNLFRAYPVHPDVAEKDPAAVFAQPFVQSYLPAMVTEYKDNKPVLENGKPKQKEGSKPVYNSKVHGKTKKDLVEEYILLVNKNAKDLGLSEDDRKEYVLPIYGQFSEDPKKNVQGINYAQAWIIYADKYPNGNSAAKPIFDELRIKKSIKLRLNALSATEAANDPLGTDPFTDIEDGRAFKIVKDSTIVPKTNMYSTEIDSTQVTEIINGKPYKITKTYPLTDAQLEHFLLQEPLAIKYGAKLATRKNFEAQLAGLQMLDTKWEMGIFDLPEWSKIVQECDSYYPENGEVVKDTATDVELEEEDIVSGDEFDLMDRKELQAFTKENKTGILVKPSLSDDDIRIKLRSWKAVTPQVPNEPLPGESGYVEPANPAAAPAPVRETPAQRQSFIDEMNEGTEEESEQYNEPEAKNETEVTASVPAAETTTAPLSAKERLTALRAKSLKAA